MTSPVKPPTSIRGHVSTQDFATLLDELTVDLPADLIWPNSVIAYASLRRQERIAAILSGYGLQIRRAQWQVDGTGCRPEIVQLVADDLGLPIKGVDRPTAARVRGVSWHEHLRAALGLHVYGHYGFELQAEMVDGKARLAGLWERPPWTVGDIHVDPTSGRFEGITQDSPASSNRAPQIPADRMVWYCREREGANWAGVALIRAAWAPMFLRREMLKVHASANRRWGLGIPVMEALPGTAPTSGQMAEAMRMAAAARAGDQAGAATPPGFAMKILGISGGVPDTLAFIRYLEQSAAQSVLMQHIDLGNTESGSRALGSVFVDSFTQALAAEAEQIADTATRQIAARLVEWNAGPDEPVPQIVVSGIGSRRDVTAESLQLLLSSGALSADPGLEEWIRREWRLPERQDPPAPARTATRRTPAEDDTDDADQEGEPAPVQAAAPRAQVRRKARRRPQPGQFTLPLAQGPAREPTELEEHSQADFAAIADELDKAQQELAEQWPTLAEAMTAALVAAVVSAAAAGTVDALGDLAVPDEAVAEIVDALTATMTRLAETAAGQAGDELRGQGVTVDDGTPDTVRLTDTANAFTHVIASGYATGAGRVALLHTGADPDADAVGDAVREHLDSLSQVADGGPGGWVATNLGGALHQAVHAGRVATFEQAPDGTRWMASAVNDRNVCGPCADDDQRIYPTLAQALEQFPAGGNKACLGSLRCRCLLVALAP